MNEPVLPQHTRSVYRGVLLIALAFSLIATTGVAAAAGSDPARPTNNKQASSPPPGGGGGDPPPQRKVALGISMQGSDDMAVFDAFTASVGGNSPAIWGLWSAWGSADTQDFPTAVAAGLKSRGAVPMFFWEPWIRGDTTDRTFRYEFITRGDHDQYIRDWARDAKAHGGKVLLRFAHEANGTYFPWTVGRLNNTLSQYIAAWRHVADIFDQEGANNVKLLWSMAKKSCSGCNPYEGFYPGDDYVDYMGFSNFNWGDIPGRSWAPMEQGFNQPVNKLSKISNKPIIVAENASNSVGGDKAAWVDQGYRAVYDTFPRVVAIVYLNYDLRHVGQPDWRLNDGSGALLQYKKIAALDKFKGKVSLKASRSWQIKSASEKSDSKDRTRKDATLGSKADRGPKVRKGSSAPDSDVDADKARSGQNKARTTQTKRGQGDEPAEPLDAFAR